jgi:hypothetical protein
MSDEGRKERQTALDAVIAMVQKERGVVWPAISELRVECEDVLERCLFDREAALAVLRGELELEDDPWLRCPTCDCDTYFRVPFVLERTGSEDLPIAAPLTMFVCEGCQHAELRGRSTVGSGAWWTSGNRFRAQPEAVGHPYRGDEVEAADVDEEADEAEPAEVADATLPQEWTERQVCPDGACIGILGANGRCSVCDRDSGADQRS